MLREMFVENVDNLTDSEFQILMKMFYTWATTIKYRDQMITTNSCQTFLQLVEVFVCSFAKFLLLISCDLGTQ